jgi:hypothetical protein
VPLTDGAVDLALFRPACFSQTKAKTDVEFQLARTRDVHSLRMKLIISIMEIKPGYWCSRKSFESAMF